ERYPHAEPAAEARWRAAWVRYLGGEMAPAADAFARLAARSAKAARIAAEYWQARALARLGRGAEARALFVHVAERHPRSYYAGLAEERLGRRDTAREPRATDQAPPFPGELAGSHAERARILAQLGLARFARLELDAIPAAEAPRRRLLEAYRAVGAVGAALRLARVMRPASPGALREYLYPLGYWETVRAAARAPAVDPLLVLAVTHEERPFRPVDVASPAARLREVRAAQLPRVRPPLCRSEPGHGQRRQPAEGAVRHDGDDVARARGGDQVVADGGHAVDQARRHAAPLEVRDDRLGREPLGSRDRVARLGEHGGEDGLVGGGERRQELVLEDTAP